MLILIPFQVSRTRGARGTVTVPYKTADGTAKAGTDYIHRFVVSGF